MHEIVPAGLNHTQRESFELIYNHIDNIIKTGMVWNNMVVLSGSAGTGKTYLTAKLIQALSAHYVMTVTAPTHKALQVLSRVIRSHMTSSSGKIRTKTLHSFLNIKLQTDFLTGIQKFVPNKSHPDLTKTDILIIDEASMIDKELYEYILEAVEAERVKAIVFIGDPYQLLPISSAPSCVFELPNHVKLTKIVRQAEHSGIIKVANQVRDMIKNRQYPNLKQFLCTCGNAEIELMYDVNHFYEDFCTHTQWYDQDQVVAAFKNAEVNSHNRILRNRYWHEQGIKNPQTFMQGDKIVFQDSLVEGETVIHHNSEQVTLISAEKKHMSFLNVSYWECKDELNVRFNVVDPQSMPKLQDALRKMANQAKKEPKPYDKKQKWQMYFTLKDQFVDVKYPFASTIHKLQGSTYHTVYIDFVHLLSNPSRIDQEMLFRLLYVALTRASHKVKLLLPPVKEVNLAAIDLRLHEIFREGFDHA